MPTVENSTGNPAPQGADRAASPVSKLPLPPPDRAVIDRFTRAMFRHADPEAFVSLRGFPHTAGPPLHIESVPAGDLAALSDRAAYGARIVAERGGVFAPPICTFRMPGDASGANVADGLALSVDIDAGDTGAKRYVLESALGPATMIVASGGDWTDPKSGAAHDKLHLHWRLAVPTRSAADHARLNDARSCAARLIGADRTGMPIVHPFRWPGTLHLKGTPRVARIVAEADTEISLDAALAALRDHAELLGVTLTARTDTRIVTRVFVEPDLPANVARAEELAKSAEPAATGSWHEIGFKLGARMCRLGLSLETTIDVLERLWVPRGTGYTSRDRFVADVTGGYESADRAEQHGQDTAEARFAGCAVPEEQRTQENSASAENGAAIARTSAPMALASAIGGTNIIPSDGVIRQELAGKLAATKKGDIQPTLANMFLVIKGDPCLKGLVGLDEFAGRMMIARPPPLLDSLTPPAPGPYPREFRDDDATRILAWMQQVWCPKFRIGDLSAVLDAEARDNAFHPVRNFLDVLTWDGVPRIDRWLTDAFNCESTPLHSAIGWKWLVAAVRRVRYPGCKFDYLPVLQGDQGIGKSRALAALFGQDFFTDQLPDNISGKEAPLSMAGKWCIELGEITQLVKNDTDTVKAFLSRSVDRYRVPYSRRPIDVPRQCVMIGTTNPGQYLRDPTGNRRFWPVACGDGPANVDWLAEHRLQLWAEAAWTEAQGVSIWLDDDTVRGEAEAAQASAMEEDPWTDRVLDHLASRQVAVVPLILSALGVPVERHDKRAQMRVGSILRIAGWTRNATWDPITGKTFRQWHAPTGQPERAGTSDPFLTTS